MASAKPWSNRVGHGEALSDWAGDGRSLRVALAAFMLIES
jgi:hypothetical protein